MIIPYSETSSRKIKIGDKVVTTSFIKRRYFMVSVGHILTYMGNDKKHNPGDILKDEETGLLIERVSILDYDLYEPSLEVAKKKHIDKKEKEIALIFIKNNCEHHGGSSSTCKEVIPHKTHPEIGTNNCKPKLSCMEYVPKSKYKDNKFIFNYIRKMKMERLKNDEITNR